MSEETPKKPRSILCVECKKADSKPGNKYCTACKKRVISKARESGAAYETFAPRVFNDQRGRKNGTGVHKLAAGPDMDRDGLNRED